MYHRIASPPFDPWGLCVPAERFREQMQALKAQRTVLPMDELAEAVHRGVAPRRATAVTFDDGYADNFTVAKPIFEELGIPVTVFLTSGWIGSERKFWWDELADLLFRTSAAASFDLELGPVSLAGSWPGWSDLPAWLSAWRVAQGARDQRTAAYLALWSALQPLAPLAREGAMEALRDQLGPPDIAAGADAAAIMTISMARDLGSALVAVGGHARSHTPLTAVTTSEATAEIDGGRDDIHALTGRLPRGFAYPHGEHDDAARRAVEKAGYSWAVTTEADTVERRGSDPFALPRIGVDSRSGSALLRTIGLRGG